MHQCRAPRLKELDSAAPWPPPPAPCTIVVFLVLSLSLLTCIFQFQLCTKPSTVKQIAHVHWLACPQYNLAGLWTDYFTGLQGRISNGLYVKSHMLAQTASFGLLGTPTVQWTRGVGLSFSYAMCSLGCPRKTLQLGPSKAQPATSWQL